MMLSEITDLTDTAYPRYNFNIRNIIVEGFSYDTVNIRNQDLDNNVSFLRLKVTGLKEDGSRLNGTVTVLGFADYDGTGNRQVEKFTPDDLERVKSIGCYFIPPEIGADEYNEKIVNYPHYLPSWKLAYYSFASMEPDQLNELLRNGFELGFGSPVTSATLFFTNRED